MNEQPCIPERFFELIDSSVTGEQRAEMLEGCVSWYYDTRSRVEQDLPLHPEDVKVLHECVQDENPKVREIAIEFLSNFGPVTWEDLEQWAMDPDQDVRSTVLAALIQLPTVAIELCFEDVGRCAALFSRVCETYVDITAGFALAYLAESGDHNLAAIQKEVERLLSLDNPEITEMLSLSYLGYMADLKLNDP